MRSVAGSRRSDSGEQRIGDASSKKYCKCRRKGIGAKESGARERL